MLHYVIRSMLGGENGGMLSAPMALVRGCSSAMPLLPRIHTVVELSNTVFKYRTVGTTLQMLIVLLVVSLFAITWTFYHAFHLLCDVMGLLTVCFAAVDSANLVFSGSRDFYVKRLSFWVLLQIWRTVSQVPFVGSGLSLLTPFAFSLFFVAGDHILLWLLIPLAGWLESLTRVLATNLASMDSPWSRGLDVERQVSAKREEPVPRSCAPKSKWQFLDETLFELFVAPLAGLLDISNMRAALAINAVLASNKSAA